MIGENDEPVYLGPCAISIRLIVNKDGTFSNIKVDLSPNEEIKNSVLNLLEEMPEWKPAMIRGTAVDSEISVIINIPVNTTME